MGVVLVVYPEGLYYANVTKEDVPEFVEEQLLKGRLVKRLLLTQAPKRFVIRREKTGLMREQPRIVLKNCGIINPESIEEYIAAGGYEGESKALTGMTPDEVISEVKRAGLAGRGGAAFPTGTKWEFGGKRRARRSSSSATRTKESRALSRTGSSLKETPTSLSKAWSSPDTP